MNALVRSFAVCALVLALSGCDQPEQAKAPPPAEVSDVAVGHFCGMTLPEHAGPKAQIFVAGRADPYWFSSVRQLFAFMRLAEEPKNVTAIYVNDMGKAKNWNQPEPGTWIDARKAWYVIGSSRRGGMEADEAIPFGERQQAEDFVGKAGGRVVGFNDMPDDYVFPGAEPSSADATDKEDRR